MTSNLDRSWNELLDPEVLRPRLAKVALFIAAFEMLKDTIIGRPSRFFESRNRGTPHPTLTDILSRNRSATHACLDWLRENEAIDDSDIAAFQRVKNCRNHLAHRMLDVLADSGLPEDFDETFGLLLSVLRKIEVWWIIRFELAADPDYDGRDVDAGEVLPGPIAGIQLLYEVALGSPEQSRYYIETFRARFGRTDA